MNSENILVCRTQFRVSHISPGMWLTKLRCKRRDGFYYRRGMKIWSYEWNMISGAEMITRKQSRWIATFKIGRYFKGK